MVQQDGNEPIPAAPLPSPSSNQDQASPPPSRPPSPLCLRSPRNPLHTRSPGDQQINDILKFPKLSHFFAGREGSGESRLAQVKFHLIC